MYLIIYLPVFGDDGAARYVRMSAIAVAIPFSSIATPKK